MNLNFHLVNDTSNTFNISAPAPTGTSWTTPMQPQVAAASVLNGELANLNAATSGSITLSGSEGFSFEVTYTIGSNNTVTIAATAPSGYWSFNHLVKGQTSTVLVYLQQDNSNWMSDMQADIQGKALREVCLPGTHDSGTSAINSNSTISSDAPGFVKTIKELLGWIKPVDTELKTIVADWAVSQPTTIAQQLQSGVRYLDIRLWWDWNSIDQTGEIYIVHSITSITLKSLIDQVLAFTQAHPQEIILLDFNHGYNFFPTATKGELVSELKAEEVAAAKAFSTQMERLQNYLIPNSCNPSSTISDLWATGKSVVAFKTSSELPSVPALTTLLWSESEIWSHWTMTHECAGTLKHRLDKVVPDSAKQAGKCWVLQSVLTPNAGIIVNGFEGDAPNLLDFALQLNTHVHKWLTNDWNTSDGANPLNIIIIDNALSIPYLSIIKARNTQS